jgi:hypothetical protein
LGFVFVQSSLDFVLNSVDVLNVAAVFVTHHLLDLRWWSYVLHHGLLLHCSYCLAQTSVLAGLFLLEDHWFYSLLHFLLNSLPHYFVPVYFSHHFAGRSGCLVDLG